jgi:hypothetical protein
MPTRSSKSILFSELLNAFEFVGSGRPFENQAYICLETGNIYFVSSIAGAEEDAPEDIEISEKYIMVPHKNDLGLGRDLAFSFVDRELPETWNTVVELFRRPGAYRRFKQMLESREMLDKWYTFEASAVEKALREWCDESGIQYSNTIGSRPGPAARSRSCE